MAVVPVILSTKVMARSAHQYVRTIHTIGCLDRASACTHAIGVPTLPLKMCWHETYFIGTAPA